MKPRVVLVEGDERLGGQVEASLRDAGYDPVWLRDGRQATPDAVRAASLVILLARPARKVSVLDVLQAFEPPHPPGRCLLLERGDGACPRTGMALRNRASGGLGPARLVGPARTRASGLGRSANRQLAAVDHREREIPRDAEQYPLLQHLAELLAAGLERRGVRGSFLARNGCRPGGRRG